MSGKLKIGASAAFIADWFMYELDFAKHESQARSGAPKARRPGISKLWVWDDG